MHPSLPLFLLESRIRKGDLELKPIIVKIGTRLIRRHGAFDYLLDLCQAPP